MPAHKHEYAKDKHHCDVCGHHRQINGTDIEAYNGIGKFLLFFFVGLPLLMTACAQLTQ